ncbi:MAG: DEAD/DEAH box helicase [Saprospiraceae bacterium]|nr:DEAD/DEAH box helicase [Saprospiraceae bacterium]
MNPFESLGLSEPICKALTELGFENPTDVQKLAVPFFLSRKSDLLALAQTGTGKTAAFGTPILQNIDTTESHTQALIITPTRELCNQITSDLKNYSKYLRGIKIVAVYGGASIVNQIRELKQSAHIIVATPGRLIDLIDRKVIKLGKINTVVLDEADEMLNMGFRDDMESILSKTPAEKLTGLFSATMSADIRKIANTYLNNPEEITIGKKNAAQQNISHQYSVVQARDKYPALRRIVDFHDDFYGIVFCSTKRETQEVSDHLIRDGYTADCLHGDLAQAQRDKVMHRFRHKAIKVLLATDVAARGIDVKNLTHIIHFHLPDDIENYTHRSGRTARAGQKGISIALLHTREAYKLHQIEKLINVKFERYQIPKGQDIVSSRLKQFIDTFAQEETEALPELNNDLVWPIMKLSKEDIVKKLLHSEISKMKLNNSDDDLNVDERDRSSRSSADRAFGTSRTGRNSFESGRDRGRSDSGRSRGERGRNDSGRSDSGRRDSGRSDSGRRSGGDGEQIRLFINLGKKDEIKYDDLREIIFKTTKVSGRAVKDIEMKGVYSFFMVDTFSADQMLKSNDGVFKGRPLRIQKASDRK